MMSRTVLALGLLVLAAVWLGPLPDLARGSFAAHMAMHMGIVAIAAPLLAIGISGSAWDPVRRVPALFPPIPLSLVELAVVWVWHAPALHHLARQGVAGLIAEQSAFLLSGLLVWLSAFGGEPARARSRAGMGVVALLLTSMHMTLLGALLALTPRALYVHEELCAGITALDDQHLGGAIMLLVGGISYLVGGLGLTAGMIRGKRARGEAAA